MFTRRANLLAAALGLFFSGCSFWSHIAHDAVEYNRTVERSNNQILLLNILRAKERLPMYFTTLSLIRGSLSSTLGAGAEATVGGGVNDAKLTPRAEYKSSPSFDVAVLDSHEFMRGILAPVSLETVRYYWDQGWPADLLLHLFVREIRLRDPATGVVTTYENEPGGGYPEFRSLLYQLLDENLRIAERKSLAGFGPSVPGKQASQLSTQLGVAGAGLQLVQDPQTGRYFLRRPAKDLVFVRDLPLPFAGAPVTLPLTDPYDQVVLRSPQGILYYLGEIAREQLMGEPNAVLLKGGIPLFVVRRNDSRAKTPAHVALDFMGLTYYIPAKADADHVDLDRDPGRSMQSLSLLAQLLALHKSAKDLPTTLPVTLVGGGP